MHKEINIKKLLKAVIGIWPIILASIIVFTAGAYTYTKFLATPLYTSKTAVYIRAKSALITVDMINAASQTMITYEELVTMNTALADVKAVLEEDKENRPLSKTYSISELRNSITTKCMEKANIVYIIVTTPNPQDSQYIADQLAKTMEAVALNVIKDMQYSVVEYANLPSSPSSPNLLQNMVIAAFIALVLTCGIAIIKEIFDNRIKDTETVFEITNAPNIGSIPRME